MIYSVIGILVIITLIAVRLLQTSGDGMKSLLARWRKPATTVTPTGIVTVAPKKPLPWMKIIGGAILIALFVHFYTGIGFLGLGRYSKTIQVEITTLEGIHVCGIESGKRKFTAPKKIPVILGGDRYDLEEWILVNGTVAKEQFVVADDGCADITFALVSNDKKKSILPQIIPIKFE